MKINMTRFSSSSRYLISDAAIAIRQAFQDVFGTGTVLIMCYAHVIMNIRKELVRLRIDKDTQDQIFSHISLLNLCNSVDVFDHATDLFIKHWASKEPEFIGYMRDKSFWFGTHKNWFHGFGSLPTTDNALESFNNRIKNETTFRKKLTMLTFLGQLFKSMEDWSSNMEYRHEVECSLELWTAASQWVGSNADVKSKILNGIAYDVVPAKSKPFPRNWRQLSTHQWKSMEDFKSKIFLLYKVFLNQQNWKLSTCTCPYFLKNYLCKHIVGLAIKSNLVVAPMEACQIPIGQKRGRGRPKKVPQRSALMRM